MNIEQLRSQYAADPTVLLLLNYYEAGEAARGHLIQHIREHETPYAISLGAWTTANTAVLRNVEQRPRELHVTRIKAAAVDVLQEYDKLEDNPTLATLELDTAVARLDAVLRDEDK